MFLVDDTQGMDVLQTYLVRGFPALVAKLAAAARPIDLHVGILRPELGAGVFAPPSCPTPGGDQGALFASPSVYPNDVSGNACATAHLTDSPPRFLTVSLDSGSTSGENFVGSLSDAFSCYVGSVGVGGCGFEHQLAAVQAAVAGCAGAGGCEQVTNAGFIRRDANLAIVVVTDEDDCSASADSTLFDPAQAALDSELGPLVSYRCFEFGVLCDGAPPGREPGARANCVPGSFDPDPRHQLIPVADLANAIKAVKPGEPRRVYVAVIAAPPAPVRVVVDSLGNPTLATSCVGGMAPAGPTPGIRLDAFVREFDDDRRRFVAWCSDGALEDGLSAIGDDLVRMVVP